MEDPVKTQQVLDKLLSRRPQEDVARRMNIGTAGVRHLAETPRRALGTALTPGVGTLSSAVVSTPYADRKLSTLALVFNSAQEMKDFEASLERFAHLLDPEVNYHNRRGQRRIDLMRLITLQLQFQLGGDETSRVSTPPRPRKVLRGGQELCTDCANDEGCPIRGEYYGQKEIKWAPIQSCAEYDSLADILGPIPQLGELEGAP